MAASTAYAPLWLWRCSQCTSSSATARRAATATATAAFSTSARRVAVGPEHPRYIDIPEPPQQSVAPKTPVKGVLPIPRNVFAGTAKDLSSDAQIALATKSPARQKTAAAPRSREEWQAKMSELRRQNLREGLKSLKARQQTELRRSAARSVANQAERRERLNMPEREDERLTAPSNNLDLHALYNKPIPDPTRQERLERKRLNIEAHALRKQEERMDALHSLYMNARDFIVTPQQLDKAVDQAFGTPEKPVRFGVSLGAWDSNPKAKSIWAEGRPERVQDMLNRANSSPSSSRAVDHAAGYSDINKERIRRIAESLTGGKMDKAQRA
ncbi:hypothetical protein Slin15195_G007650 [Septoria linicola]|uniref:Uncharacterized protein n=1 Tax=Septoria linicola TaxID=215465 RepID=A0A9Q9ED66_9PEZI|nr:hypothetical protein Slin14017_G007660 [Septoria linicola]USW47446.1 hypothetical protein Slin15195_G007650 [Septoria linicola]